MTTSRDIVVPGSISNLGPGLDTLSVAVRLNLRVHIEEVSRDRRGLEIDVIGEPPPGENRLERAFHLASARFGPPDVGVRITAESDIPMRAGLGSSGAAAVAGLRLYEAVTSPRPREDWLALAVDIEGHPDNAAAALLGGMVTSCRHDDGRVSAWRRPWPEDIRMIAATPAEPLDTAISRSVLPACVPLADAVFNLQRTLLFLHAIEHHRYADLREALRDRWHQSFRAPLVPGLADALALEHPALLGIFLSGAGPSIVALATDHVDEISALLRALYDRLGVACTIRTLEAEPPFED